jgi:hypothetical protein
VNEAGAGTPTTGTSTLLLAVMFDVALGCLLGMVTGVKLVPVGHMCVMRRFLVRIGLVVLRGLHMMVGCVLEVLGRLLVMFRSLFRHVILLA